MTEAQAIYPSQNLVLSVAVINSNKRFFVVSYMANLENVVTGLISYIIRACVCVSMNLQILFGLIGRWITLSSHDHNSEPYPLLTTLILSLHFFHSPVLLPVMLFTISATLSASRLTPAEVVLLRPVVLFAYQQPFPPQDRPHPLRPSQIRTNLRK